MGGFFTFLAVVFLAFLGFSVYFIFKQIQFVIQAVDLYKAMVVRLDKVIELLSQYPRNPNLMASIAATASSPTIEKAGSGANQQPKAHEVGPVGICPNCDARIPLTSTSCPKCKADFGAGSAWKIKTA